MAASAYVEQIVSWNARYVRRFFEDLALARQSPGLSQGAAVDLGISLHVPILTCNGKEIVVEHKGKGNLIRALLNATLRREPEPVESLISAVLERERNWCSELRRPTDSDREQRIAHAVTPLLTAIVS